MSSRFPRWCRRHVVLTTLLMLPAFGGAVAASNAGCTGFRTCETTICTRFTGTCVTTTLSGPAFARVEWTGPQGTMNWVVSRFEGEVPGLGPVVLSLVPEAATTGVLLPLDPTCVPTAAQPFCLPALNRNDFYFRIEPEDRPALISTRPVRIEAIVSAIPPVGTQYRLVNGPVEFHIEGDPAREPMVTIERAVINFAAVPVGACEQAAGACDRTSKEVCDLLGGAYRGNGTRCR